MAKDETLRIIIKNVIEDEERVKKLAKTYQTSASTIRKAEGRVRAAQAQTEKQIDKKMNAIRREELELKRSMEQGRKNLIKRQKEKSLIAKRELEKRRAIFNKKEKELAAVEKKRILRAERIRNEAVSSVTTMRQVGSATERVTTTYNKFGKQLKKTRATIKGTFQMWALSIMFFGMLLQRTFDRIIRSGLDMLKSLAKGSTEQSRALAALEAHWTFLKFTIGNAIMTALLPLMPLILNIISRIRDWIEKHPKLTAAIILLSFVIGILLFAFGSLFLAEQGFVMMVGFLKDAINGLISLFTFLMSPIGLIILALLALAVAWETNFLGIRDKTAAFVMWFLQNVWMRGLRTVFIAIIKSLQRMWIQFKTNFQNIYDFSKVIWNGIKWIIGSAWNGIISILETGVNAAITLLRPFIDIYDKLAETFGWTKIMLDNVDFSGARIEVSGYAGMVEDSLKRITDRSRRAMEEIRALWTSGWDWGKLTAKQIEEIGKKIKEFSIIETIMEKLSGLGEDLLGGISPSTPTETSTSKTTVVNNEININVEGEDGRNTAERMWEMLEPYMSSTQGVV